MTPACSSSFQNEPTTSTVDAGHDPPALSTIASWLTGPIVARAWPTAAGLDSETCSKPTSLTTQPGGYPTQIPSTHVTVLPPGSISGAGGPLEHAVTANAWR